MAVSTNDLRCVDVGIICNTCVAGYITKDNEKVFGDGCLIPSRPVVEDWVFLVDGFGLRVAHRGFLFNVSLDDVT